MFAYRLFTTSIILVHCSIPKVQSLYRRNSHNCSSFEVVDSNQVPNCDSIAHHGYPGPSRDTGDQKLCANNQPGRAPHDGFGASQEHFISMASDVPCHLCPAPCGHAPFDDSSIFAVPNYTSPLMPGRLWHGNSLFLAQPSP